MYALKDIVPPTYRKRLYAAAESGYAWASSGLSFSGKTLWVVSTSALLLGVPWALAFSEEQQVLEMEREMRMQQSANEVCLDKWRCWNWRWRANICARSFLHREELVDNSKARDRLCKERDGEKRESFGRFWRRTLFCAVMYTYSACIIFSALSAGAHDGIRGTRYRGYVVKVLDNGISSAII